MSSNSKGGKRSNPVKFKKKVRIIEDIKQAIIAPAVLPNHIPATILIAKGSGKSYDEDEKSWHSAQWRAIEGNSSSKAFHAYNQRHCTSYEDNSIAIATGGGRSIESIRAIAYHQFLHALLDGIKREGTVTQRLAFDHFIENYKVAYDDPFSRRVAMLFFGHSWSADYGDERWIAHEAFIAMSRFHKSYCDVVKRIRPALAHLVDAYADLIQFLSYDSVDALHFLLREDIQPKNDHTTKTPITPSEGSTSGFIDILLELEEEIARYADFVTPYGWKTFHLLSDGSMLAFKDIIEEVKSPEGNQEEDISGKRDDHEETILVHIIRQYGPDNFWEPEWKRFEATEKYRRVIASLTDEQVSMLIQKTPEWPELQRRRKVAKYEDKIRRLVELYPRLEMARKDAATLDEGDLDGWIPYMLSSEGKVVASKYVVVEGGVRLHASREFDPVGPWEKIANVMRLQKAFNGLTEWMPETALDEFRRRVNFDPSLGN